MIKELIKIGNRLDSLGLKREGDMIDRLIRKIAQDSGWEMEMFYDAREVSEEEVDAWKDGVERAWRTGEDWEYGENEVGYDHFDLEVDGKIYTVYYSLKDEGNVIKEDTTKSPLRLWKKRIERLEREHKELSDLVKGGLPNIAGIFDYGSDFIRFIHNDKVYELRSAIGLHPERGDVELTILGKTVGGEEVDWPKNREEALEMNGLEEFGGLEWLVSSES